MVAAAGLRALCKESDLLHVWEIFEQKGVTLAAIMEQHFELILAEGGNDATYIHALRAGDPHRSLLHAHLLIALQHSTRAFHMPCSTLLLQQRRHRCQQP